MTDAERKRQQRRREAERIAQEAERLAQQADDLSSRQGGIAALQEHIARVADKLRNLPVDADRRVVLITRVNLEMVTAMAEEQIREIRELIDFHIE